MEHKMKLDHAAFIAIKSKTKTIEMRLYDEKRRELKKGDSILFTDISTKEEIIRYIYKLHIFPTFEELYKKFNKINLGYSEKENADAKDMLQYYTVEDIKKYGVVGIELKTKKDYDLSVRIQNTMDLLNGFVDENLPKEEADKIKKILNN